MFKKKLKLSSFKEDVDVRVTNTKNDGPSYYPETKRGREFFDAHAKANPVIDKTGSPEHQFKSNLKKIDDHGPPKVDTYAGDPHSNVAIKAQRMEMMPRVKVHKEETELTEEAFQQLDENVRKEHYMRHHARSVAATQELMRHLNDHSKMMQDPHYNKGYYDMYNVKDIASKIEDAALSMGTHVEQDRAYIENQKKQLNPVMGMRESVEEKKYVSSSKTIRELLGKK